MPSPWLAQMEAEEAHLTQALTEAAAPPRLLQVQPDRVLPYLEDLRTLLLRGGAKGRELLHREIERIVIHPPETPKPSAMAEVITTGKGLLDSVAFVVAGAGFEPATFGL